ncbi:MAG: bifunctional oligoribonuclease/PAP phosphatase NrnA [Deltaproteobacteria bacterium]|jgi:phosphoesterase RecJ-like protein|nr:bifunctional oligoribonuclease/PAP phosphatase NrnA [Deltaproteobacteria bacterium]
MLNPPKQVPEQVTEALRQAESVVIVSHVFPDADAIGSQLALGNILESQGKRVFYYCQEFALSLHEFIPGSKQLSNKLPDISQFDVGIAVDCGDRYRLGEQMDTLLQIHPFIVIDHHAGHKEFGDIRWVEAGRSSSAEMIFDLAQALDAEISYRAAFCLYTAIVSDTGSFKYESTTAYTLQVAGHLLKLGIKPSEVAGKLFDNYTVNRLRLLEKVLGSLKLYFEDQIAVIKATNEMFEATGALREDTEEFINLPRALRSVKVAAFLKETLEGYIKVSLRAKGECDVSLVAMQFGGGGHRNAAGFRIKDKTLGEVSEDLLQEIKRRL